MNHGSASRKLNMKSISLEDLGSIVRHMISGALDDTDQMAKLHRAIYEEFYFEKITECGGEGVKKNSCATSSQEKIKVATLKHISEHAEEYADDDSRTICVQSKTNDPNVDCGDDLKIDEIHCDSASNIRIEEKKIGIQKHRRGIQRDDFIEEHKKRNEEAFDVWKREKTRSMRLLLREERKKRREEFQAQQAEFEQKAAAREAHLRLRKHQRTQRKIEDARRQAIKAAYLKMQEQQNEIKGANEEALKPCKEQKNNQSRRNNRQPQKQSTQTRRAKYRTDAVFDSWLDQLDSVLHQKYLRERRYLVRSFYCQPTYYGTAALSMQ